MGKYSDKKPVYKREFKEIVLRRSLVALVIVAVLFGVTFVACIKMKKHQYDRALVKSFSSIEEPTINRLTSEDPGEVYGNYLYGLCSSSYWDNCLYNADTYYALVDEATGEIVADSELKVLVIYKTGDGEESKYKIVYNDDPESFEPYLSRCAFPAFEGTDQFGFIKMYFSGGIFELKDLYVNGETFLPGTVRCHEKVSAVGYMLSHPKEALDFFIVGPDPYAYIDESTIETITFEQGEIEGYEHLDSGVINITCMGNAPDSEFLKNARSCVKGERKAKSYQAGLNEYEEMKYQEITLPDGHAYTLYMYMGVENVFLKVDVILSVALLIYVVLAVIVVLVSSNVTRRKNLLRSAVEDYRVNLINSMAHDMKTPLMAVSGYSENIANGIHSEKHEYYAGEIVNNVKYMDGIINDFTAFSELDTLEKGLVKTNVDLMSLLRGQLEKYNDILSERNITIESSGTFKVSADSKLMLRVADNITSNLLKYAKDGSRITIAGIDSKACRQKGLKGIKRKNCALVVTNETDEKITCSVDKLTSPFVKGDKSRSKRQGSGLGLSIVENILKMHGMRQEISFEDGVFEQIIIG